MADPELQRIIDDLRKRREILENVIAESAHKTAEKARALLDVDRIRERFGRQSGDPSSPQQTERDQRD